MQALHAKQKILGLDILRAIAILLPLFDNINRLPKFLAYIFAWISKISYAMYLSNLLIFQLIIYIVPFKNLSLGQGYMVFWVYFEQKILQYRDKNFVTTN